MNENFKNTDSDGQIVESILGLVQDLQVFWKDFQPADSASELCTNFFKDTCQQIVSYRLRFQFENPELCFLV